MKPREAIIAEVVDSEKRMNNVKVERDNLAQIGVIIAVESTVPRSLKSESISRVNQSSVDVKRLRDDNTGGAPPIVSSISRLRFALDMTGVQSYDEVSVLHSLFFSRKLDHPTQKPMTGRQSEVTDAPKLLA